MAGDKQSESGDRKGDRRADLSRVIDGASNSAMDEVLDAGQWSADRMRMEPGERGDLTGSTLAMMFLLVASNEFVSPKDASKRMGVSEIELLECLLNS